MAFKAHYVNNVRTPVGVVTYPHLEKPSAVQEGQDPKYSCGLMVPKSDAKLLGEIAKAIAECGKESFGAGDKEAFAKKQLNWPIRDGDDMLDSEGEPREDTKGMYILTARSNKKPIVVGPDRSAFDVENVYAGGYARLNFSVGSYNTAGNRGVTFYLNAVQWMRDGERLGGGAPPVNDMFDDESDEADDYEDDPLL